MLRSRETSFVNFVNAFVERSIRFPNKTATWILEDLSKRSSGRSVILLNMKFILVPVNPKTERKCYKIQTEKQTSFVLCIKVFLNISILVRFLNYMVN